MITIVGAYLLMVNYLVGCFFGRTQNRIGDWRSLVDQDSGGIYVPAEAVALKAEKSSDLFGYKGLITFNLPNTRAPEEWLKEIAHRTPDLSAGKLNPLEYRIGNSYEMRVGYDRQKGHYHASWWFEEPDGRAP